MALLLRRMAAFVRSFRVGFPLALLYPRLAIAEPRAPREEGVEFAFRGGYSIPFGKAAGGTSQNPNDLATGRNLGDVVTGAFPIWLDAGYRVVPSLMIGVYAAYEFGNAGSSLSSACADCGVHIGRVGLEAHYHFLPWRRLDPWLGAGIGYEALTVDFSAQGQDASVTMSGFELLQMQAGLDIAMTRPSDIWFALGPFVSFALSTYSDASCSGPGTRCDGITDTAMHEWLTLGLRGVLLP